MFYPVGTAAVVPNLLLAAQGSNTILHTLWDACHGASPDPLVSPSAGAMGAPTIFGRPTPFELHLFDASHLDAAQQSIAFTFREGLCGYPQLVYGGVIAAAFYDAAQLLHAQGISAVVPSTRALQIEYQRESAFWEHLEKMLLPKSRFSLNYRR